MINFYLLSKDTLLMYYKFDYKYNNQPLLLVLGGYLEEKNKQIS